MFADALGNVAFMGSVKPYFEANLKNNSSLVNKLAEASRGAATAGGILEYGGLYFTEYKVGRETRFFGNSFKGRFCVYLIATRHRGNYEGMTWDGKETFKSEYLSSPPDPDTLAEQAYFKALKQSPHLMNSSKAPEPIFD